MDVSMMKEYILENGYIPVILENSGCHGIKNKGGYITCANPDGDNLNAVTVYLNPNLTAINYTRSINSDKNSHDIFDLIGFYLNLNFFETVKRICDWIELDYYKDWEEDLSESLRITKMLLEMNNGGEIEDEDIKLKPISEKILTYYYPYVNDYFMRDNISYSTQRKFEIGYDDFTDRITIPIRDELGNLVGVKGRILKKELAPNDQKYLYIEKCRRSQILYGLNISYPYIRREKCVFICESEKGVMQLYDMGIYNSVATGGKKVSQVQIDKLSRLCAALIFCFDKDVGQSEIGELAGRFIENIEIYALIDSGNILDDKESPTDNPQKFRLLVEKNKFKIR